MTVRRFRSALIDDIHPPYREGPWSRHGVQVSWRGVDLVSMDLTLTALLYEVHAIALYSKPEVTCPHYLLGEHEAAHVWTANSSVYFLH